MSTCAPLLDSCLIDQMTSAMASVLVDTFKIQQYTETPDGSGGLIKVWSDAATGIAGFFAQSPFQSIEANIGGSQQAERRWQILLTKGTVVDETMRIIQTHSSGVAISPQRTFKVVTVHAGDTMASVVKCECTELPNLQ